MVDVLVVCRANLCRSPAVELMIRSALGPAGDVRVTSAGLRPVIGARVPTEVSQWLLDRGMDVSTHRPRGLVAREVEAADLVVVMTRSQRSALLRDHPTVLHRTVLLSEVADRVVSDGRRGGRGLTVLPATRRSAEDLPDPYGRPADEVAAILTDAEDAVRRSVAALS